MIEDIDSVENNIKFLGLLRMKGIFKIKTTNGHRFHLVPHKLEFEPPYHPRTDREFFIEPYCQINVYEEMTNEIIIDDGSKLSELNHWKFNALKLDYLLREIIRLGGEKNAEGMGIVLDLHQDIKLNNVEEYEKDIAGIPSELTNIT
jgi:hypothetical protein